MILKFLFMAFLLSPITCEFVSISAQMEVSSLNSVVHSCTNRSRQFETNPRGCSWFWHCKDNEGNLFDHPMEGVCPDRLYFNYYLQSCSYDDGTCTYDEDNFNKIPTTCTDWRMDLIPHVFNCSKYYLCWENYTHPMECPEDLHFSYFENNCTVQNLADCRVDHNYCRRMRRDDVKVRKSPYDCNTYHVCNECNREFSLIEFECNKETHQFNETLQHCDITANVNCQITPPEQIPVEKMPPNPLSIVCSASDRDQGFVKHPDCHYYFNCASGRSRLLKCPGNTYFRRDINQCWSKSDPNDTCDDIYPQPT